MAEIGSSAVEPDLILGSASPRRADLLASLGLAFRVQAVEVDERALVDADDASGTRSVIQIAQAKFAAFDASSPSAAQGILLTADTLVACDQVIMGKPAGRDDASDMLRRLSGRVASIATAVCVGEPGERPFTQLVVTYVTLRELRRHEISEYVASGAGDDKAGALALQDKANAFIASVDGCWSNVLGLPLCAVSAALDPAPSASGQLDRCSTQLCGRRPVHQ